MNWLYSSMKFFNLVDMQELFCTIELLQSFVVLWFNLLSFILTCWIVYELFEEVSLPLVCVKSMRVEYKVYSLNISWKFIECVGKGLCETISVKLNFPHSLCRHGSVIGEYKILMLEIQNIVMPCSVYKRSFWNGKVFHN